MEVKSMAGRTDRAKGRVKESAGALADHKRLKGSVKKRAAKAQRKVDPR
jgi:uncharacterized protein YjbJ (UPF0337 family)